MPARQPLPAALRLRQWLLLVLTIAGLLCWQGVHCADDSAPHSAAGISATHPHTGASTETVTHGEPAAHQAPGSADEDCHAAIKTTTGCTSSPVVLAAASSTYPAVTPQTRPPAASPAPVRVTLIALGISRT